MHIWARKPDLSFRRGAAYEWLTTQRGILAACLKITSGSQSADRYSTAIAQRAIMFWMAGGKHAFVLLPPAQIQRRRFTMCVLQFYCNLWLLVILYKLSCGEEPYKQWRPGCTVKLRHKSSAEQAPTLHVIPNLPTRSVTCGATWIVPCFGSHSKLEKALGVKCLEILTSRSHASKRKCPIGLGAHTGLNIHTWHTSSRKMVLVGT